MKPNVILLLAAGALALAGCSSTPSKVDTGPIRARTFNFVNTPSKPAPEFTDNRQALHTMIQADITKALASRGVSRVNAGGDVTVGYLVIIGNNATTTAINDYFGYSEDATALHEKAHSAYSGNKNPNYFEAGTLVIDIIDSKNYKLVRRNHATRPILRNPSADAQAARIQEVVNEVLAGVQFVP